MFPSNNRDRRKGAEKGEFSGELQFIASILPSATCPSADMFMLW